MVHKAELLSLVCIALVFVACESSTTTHDAETSSGPAFSVVYRSTVVEPDLKEAQAVEIGGTTCKGLASVASLAFPHLDLSTVMVDFLASDGFKPAKSPNCTAIVPISGELLEKGCIILPSHDLKWDASLGWPGCMSIKGAVQMELMDK